MNNISSSRDAVRDIAKALCIILVVYGHMCIGMDVWGGIPEGSLLNFITFLIYSFHMPVFFLLAGYNALGGLRRHNPQTYLQGKLWSIVYPYLVWSTVFVVMKMLVSAQVTRTLGPADLLKIPYHPFAQFWFLYALMLMHVAALALRNRIDILNIGAAAAALVGLMFPEQLPNIILRTVLHLPFFCAGLALAPRAFPSVAPKSYRFLLLVMFAGTLVASGWVAYPGAGVLTPLAVPLTMAAGMALILGLSQTLAETRLSGRLAWLGRQSMVIFLAHTIFTFGVRAALKKAKIDDVTANLALGTLVGVFAPLALYAVLARVGLESWAGFNGKSPLKRTA
jgi:fucose 4-O-acetylase-like acetyltransferase